jgi:hypothetical protein
MIAPIGRTDRLPNVPRSGDEVAIDQLAVFGELLVVLARYMDNFCVFLNLASLSCGERPPARLRDPHAGTSIGCRPATVRRRLPSRARH